MSGNPTHGLLFFVANFLYFYFESFDNLIWVISFILLLEKLRSFFESRKKCLRFREEAALMFLLHITSWKVEETSMKMLRILGADGQPIPCAVKDGRGL